MEHRKKPETYLTLQKNKEDKIHRALLKERHAPMLVPPSSETRGLVSGLIVELLILGSLGCLEFLVNLCCHASKFVVIENPSKTYMLLVEFIPLVAHRGCSAQSSH
jgi:hypothetical protein